MDKIIPFPVSIILFPVYPKNPIITISLARIELLTSFQSLKSSTENWCFHYMVKVIPFPVSIILFPVYNISGQKWASDKIPKPKTIYWEVDIWPKGQNNSISCFKNSISYLVKAPYKHNILGSKWSIDKNWK